MPLYVELRADEAHRALVLRTDEAGQKLLCSIVGRLLTVMDIVRLAIEGTEFTLLDPVRDLNAPNAPGLPALAAGVVRDEQGKLTAITGYGGMVFYDNEYRDAFLGPSILRLREHGNIIFRGTYLSEIRAARGEPR